MSVGFDRYLRLAWCDRALEEAARTTEPAEARARLDEALSAEIEGDRSRAVTVRLLHQIWLAPPSTHRRLRDEAVAAYEQGNDTRPLHWGMSMAEYPFFRVVAEAVGRDLRLHNGVSAPTVLRRVAEEYGERPTVRRSAQRVLQSMVDWGLLTRDQDGTYRTEDAVSLSHDLTAWALSATLWSAQASSRTGPTAVARRL